MHQKYKKCIEWLRCMLYTKNYNCCSLFRFNKTQWNIWNHKDLYCLFDIHQKYKTSIEWLRNMCYNMNDNYCSLFHFNNTCLNIYKTRLLEWLLSSYRLNSRFLKENYKFCRFRYKLCRNTLTQKS